MCASPAQSAASGHGIVLRPRRIALLLGSLLGSLLGWLRERHELAAGRAALSRFEAHYPSLLAQAEAALAAVEQEP